MNKYIGMRYVPLIYGVWDNTRSYEPLTIVTYEGNSYTSKTYVPENIQITNETYWALTGNYNAQVEQYRSEFNNFKSDILKNYITPQNFGAKGDGIADDTTAIQNAIDFASAYVWQGNVSSTTHNVQYGTVYFPKGIYRITSKIKLNAGVKLVGVGIEKASDWNSRMSVSSCIYVDYTNELDFAFDVCPYDITGNRVNNHVGTGGEVNNGTNSSCEGIEIHNLTFFTDKIVRGFNIALSPMFLMNNCYVKGFTLGIRISASWYSTIKDTTFEVRWRGISTTNAVNNLNLSNVGIMKSQTLGQFTSINNDGCEYDSLFKESCGINCNWSYINAYGLTIEWFDVMLSAGNGGINFDGVWCEQIGKDLVRSSYSNIKINFQDIVCPTANVFQTVASKLSLECMTQNPKYAKIFGWVDDAYKHDVSLKGFIINAADEITLNNQQLRECFVENANNRSINASIYVDATNGLDKNLGDLPSRPLKTLKQALLYSQEIGKKVTIYLPSDQTFSLTNTVISTKDVTLTSIGEGAKPIIDFSTEYSGISCATSGANVVFRNLVINNYGTKNDGYRNIVSFKGKGIINVSFINCNINIGETAQIVGPELSSSYLANIQYVGCTIDGYGTTTKTYGRLSYDIWKDDSSDTSYNDIAINEFASHTTKNSQIMGYGTGNLIEKIHSTLDQ